MHINKDNYLCTPKLKSVEYKYITKMKKDIHPSKYRDIVFKDMSNDQITIVKSAAPAKETIEIEGKKYPLIKMEISSSSHPFYTGKMKFVDSAGRVDKFNQRYKKKTK